MCQNAPQVVYLKTFLALEVNNAFTVKSEKRSASVYFFSIHIFFIDNILLRKYIQ